MSDDVAARADVLQALSESRNQQPSACCGSSTPENSSVIQDYLAQSSPSIALEERRKCNNVHPSTLASWLFRVLWSGPTVMLQWMPLPLSLAQMLRTNNPVLPLWVRSILEPDSFLYLYALVNALTTIFITDPELAVATVKRIYNDHKFSFPGWQKWVITLKFMCILVLGLFGDILGGLAFYPVVEQLPVLQNDTYQTWVDIIEGYSSIPVFYPAAWWITHLVSYATSGLQLSSQFVNFLFNFFLPPKKRESVRIIKKMQQMRDNPAVLNDYFSMVKAQYRQSSAQPSSRALLDFLNSMHFNSEDLITAAVWKSVNDASSFRPSLFNASVILLAIIISWGMLSFYFSALNNYPLPLALIEIAVSFKLVSWMSAFSVRFLSRLPTLKERSFNPIFTAVHGLLQSMLLIYTSAGSIGEIFLENSLQLLDLQIVSNYLMIFFFDMPAVFFFFSLIEEGLLKWSAKNMDSSEEKLVWLDFRKQCLEALNKSLSDRGQVVRYVTQSFEKYGDQQRLMFGYLWGGRPLKYPKQMNCSQSLSLAQILNQLKEFGCELELTPAQWEFMRVGSEVSINVGQLIDAKEDSIPFRMFEAFFVVLGLAAALGFSLDDGHSNVDTPWLERGAVVPLLAVCFAAYVSNSVFNILNYSNRVVRYKAIKPQEEERGDRAIDFKQACDQPTARILFDALLMLPISFAVSYALYAAIAVVMDVAVEPQIANFTSDQRKVIDGSVLAGVLLLLLMSAYAVKRILHAIPLCQQPVSSYSVFTDHHEGEESNNDSNDQLVDVSTEDPPVI